MHLIVPFAGTVSTSGRQALQSLALPHLERLLARFKPTQTLGSDEYSLSPPHELALAASRGWPLGEPALPWAADAARRAGLPTADQAWALLTPVHLHLGTDQVTLTDPAELQLGESDSRELFEAVRSLFETEGFGLHWTAADQWLATHALFDGLATASLDRVIGRNVDRWLPDQRQARLLRRLQNEVQMLLYTHPLNDRREAAGLPSVNSFWCSGTGRAPRAAAAAAHQAVNQAANHAANDAASEPRIDASLRAPALAEDWAAWCKAWRAIDDGPLAEMLTNQAGVQLTLCGERRATRFESAPRRLWQRLSASWRQGSAVAALELL